MSPNFLKAVLNWSEVTGPVGPAVKPPTYSVRVGHFRTAGFRFAASAALLSMAAFAEAVADALVGGSQ